MEALDVIRAYEIFRSHGSEIPRLKEQWGDLNSSDLNPNHKGRVHGDAIGIGTKQVCL